MNSQEQKQRAAIIYKQLGGNRFVAMTGAKQFVCDDKGIYFKIGKNAINANFVKILVNSLDLYDIEYCQVRAGSVTVKAKSENIFCDQLQEDFTKKTGLYTSF